MVAAGLCQCHRSKRTSEVTKPEAAATAFRQVIRTMPRDVEQAADMACELIRIEAAANAIDPDSDLGLGGPVHMLGLVPGRQPIQPASHHFTLAAT